MDVRTLAKLQGADEALIASGEVTPEKSCRLAAGLGNKSEGKKWWTFLGGAVVCLAYFALIVFLLLPRR
jgi:hypothetical protein